MLLAGDIAYLGTQEFDRYEFWDWASENYKEVVVAIGNHELYQYYDLSTLSTGFTHQIRPNVKCYYNEVVTIDDTDIITSTLWSHISKERSTVIENSVSDFFRIRNGEELLDWRRFNEEHSKCFEFIKDSTEQSLASKIVVVSHHVPSFELTAAEFSGSKINEAFNVELASFIKESTIDFWIYGHSHRNIEKRIGNTQCLTNQLGYVHMNEHHSFRHDAHFTV